MRNDISIRQKLTERVKELSCLYGVSSAIRKHSASIDQTLEEICAITQQAWLYPEHAIVHLESDDYSLQTNSIPKKKIQQKTNIVVFQKKKGVFSVYYDTQIVPEAIFLEEEQRLLNKIGIEISEFFERVEIKEKQRLLKRRAERNDRLSILGEITAGIAHELNTPLGNILGFAELIRSNSKEPQTKKDTEKIIKAAIYSREVVKKLMFSSCEMPQHQKFIKIKPLIEQALKLLGPNFKKAEVHSQFRIDNPQIKAQIDGIQFTQVLFNLLINAIYIAPKNSTIAIDVSTTETHFYLKVKDEGPGIPENLKSKIFEPFFSSKPVGEGSGLGLSVVHGIVKSHRGEIDIFENEPVGTVFQLKLPLKM